MDWVNFVKDFELLSFRNSFHQSERIKYRAEWFE